MEFEKVKKFILQKLKKELPRSLSYHSIEHIKDVYHSAKILAKMENIKGEDLKLLLVAALFHDSGFLWQQYEHEQVSCEIATKFLPDFGFTAGQIKRICGMIMATKLPQTPHNKLEELICDADLDYLGRDDFFRIGNGLYKEFRMYGILSTEDEWNHLQLRFLEKHSYFTESAKKLRQWKKDEHIAAVKAKLKK